jgi:AcrR family transcriptional regulator
MAYVESHFSPKQWEMLKREESILAAAESILISDGFFDMSMVRIAQQSKYSRATIYLHFVSREDIVVALASKAWEKRLELLARGASYPGRPRIRMGGVAEGFALFFAIYPNSFSILHKTTQAICEKASPHRLQRLRAAEGATADLLRGLIDEAVRVGDLKTEVGDVDEIIFALSSLSTGGFALHELGFPQATLRVHHAMDKFWHALNVLADAYGWRPLFKEVDWDETLADIRRTLFPEEAQQAYGPDAWWYGEWGLRHPKNQANAVVAAGKPVEPPSLRHDTVP